MRASNLAPTRASALLIALPSSPYRSFLHFRRRLPVMRAPPRARPLSRAHLRLLLPPSTELARRRRAPSPSPHSRCACLSHASANCCLRVAAALLGPPPIAVAITGSPCAASSPSSPPSSAASPPAPP
mmetsp:Transcript_24928/g.52166  ORF Transcript_24928/g.52166 Transcript_24928/m.52166 type:complete len:128 (+) Transcript_24928:737-1120(+)